MRQSRQKIRQEIKELEALPNPTQDDIDRISKLSDTLAFGWMLDRRSAVTGRLRRRISAIFEMYEEAAKDGS